MTEDREPIERRLAAWAATTRDAAGAALAREAAAALVTKAAIGAAARPRLAMDAPLNAPEALFALCDMLEDWQDPSGIRLRVGDGAYGYGLYVASLDEPDWPERLLYHLDPPRPISE